MTARLSVNVNDECADSIRAYATAHGCTVTEATRRAISLLNAIDVQTTLGNRMAVVDRDSTIIAIWELPTGS